jgi:hypothetical protein
MSYRKAIESISDWQEMTDAGVIAAAKAKSFLYVDSDRWTLLGIAQIIGPTEVTGFIAFCESIGYGWIATQAAGSGLPIGDPVFNSQLLAIPDPRCQAIAAAGRRYISPCERFGVAENDTAIQTAISLLRLEIDRRLIRKQGSDIYNEFCQVVDQWDGTGERPSLCANVN